MKPVWQYFYVVLFVFHHCTKLNVEFLSYLEYDYFCEWKGELSTIPPYNPYPALYSGVSAAQEVLPSWDRQVQNLCFQVNNVIEKINVHAPDWAEKYLESQMST